MPQIKFSGLVTAMKGKAGGSIFSQNKQGAYFRNNRWGGGRKSARWDAAKVKLSTLSNSWRALSAKQRQAWQDAAANFPFTNKFGEQYIASGYQVYMSCNGNLFAHSLPLLTSPGDVRPFPTDMNFGVSTPDIPWVTGGSGATFPVYNDGVVVPCSGPLQCPQHFMCEDGKCIPAFPVGSPEYNKLRQAVRDQYYMFVEPECTTDSDCVDQGLTGASADVECVDGRCVYVGDSLVAYEQLAYVLNIGDALFNGGVWDNTNTTEEAFIAGSFRFSLGEQSLRKLLTTQSEIVLVSNYNNDGRGTTIRIVRLDESTTRVYVTYGLLTSDTVSGKGTYVWYQDYLTSEFRDNSVLQFQFNLADTTNSFIALNNSGFSYGQFQNWDSYMTGSISSWGDPSGLTHNPYSNWETAEYWQGFVYGNGLLGGATSVRYSDLRFYSDQQAEPKYALSGMLAGNETVLILASGAVNPGCTYRRCDGIFEFMSCGLSACYCDSVFCGPWPIVYANSENKAPGGSTNIFLRPAAPVIDLTEVDPGQYTVSFAGYWVNLKGGHYENNGATFVPLTTGSIQGTTESGFYVSVSVTKAKKGSTNVRESEFINMTLLPAEISADYELWDYIKPAITSAPPGTEFWIGFNIIDVNSGVCEYGGKKKIRFKAGADLSSSVN